MKKAAEPLSYYSPSCSAASNVLTIFNYKLIIIKEIADRGKSALLERRLFERKPLNRMLDGFFLYINSVAKHLAKKLKNFPLKIRKTAALLKAQQFSRLENVYLKDNMLI